MSRRSAIRTRTGLPKRPAWVHPVPKAPTGIVGLDEITGGGLPRGRPTLVCGGPGCGKTVLAMEFLVRGALEHGEPGVFVSFEESVADLTANFASLAFDIPGLVKRKLLAVDYVSVARNEVTETGEYDLEGLFIRLGHAIDTIGAKRVPTGIRGLDEITSGGLPRGRPTLVCGGAGCGKTMPWAGRKQEVLPSLSSSRRKCVAQGTLTIA